MKADRCSAEDDINARSSGEISCSVLNGETPSNCPLMVNELSFIRSVSTAVSDDGVVVVVVRTTSWLSTRSEQVTLVVVE